MFRSTRSVLFYSFIILAVAAFVIFAVIAVPNLEMLSERQIKQDLIKQVKLVADDVREILVSRKPQANLQEYAQKTAQISGSRITIITPSGRVIADSTETLDRLSAFPNHLDRPEIIGARLSGEGFSIRHSTTTGEQLLYAAVALKGSDNRISGYLRFSSPSSYILRSVENIYLSMLFAFLIYILAAVIIANFFSLWFSKPIARLSEITKRIAEGDFSQVIIRKSGSEVGDLERSVEEMSNKLAEMFKKVDIERGRRNAIFAGMKEGVLVTDMSGNIKYANPAIEKIFGRNADEMGGMTPREALFNNEISDLIEKSRAHGIEIEEKIQIYSPVNANFSVYCGPVKDPKGEILGFICVLHDITQLKMLEQYRSEFVANVSHELKTPLTAIRSYVETLLNGAIDDRENNRRFIENIDKHAKNLSSLIDDILEVARLETGRNAGEFKTFILKDVLKKCLDVVDDKAKKKGLNISAGCAEDLIVKGVEEHIYRVLLNVIDNAINYTDSGGNINISCTGSKDNITISVKDTGIGIPEESLPRIFERFFRADTARSRESGGTGLGLAIVKHIIELHKGSISVKSEIGKGSEFTLTFPADN